MPVPARLIGMAFALAAAIAFATNPPFAKLAVGEGFAPINAAFLRAAFMLVAVLAITRVTGIPLAVPKVARATLGWLCLGAVMVNLCYLASVSFIPVGLAAVIFYTFPLIILVLTPFLDREPLTPVRIAAFVLAFCGLALAIAPAAAKIDWRGIALALGASGGEVLLFFAAARVSRHLSSLTMTFWAHLFIVPGGLAVVVAFGDPTAFPDTALGLAALAAICLSYAAGFSFQLAAAAYAPPAALSVVFYVEPVITAGLAALLLAEQLTPFQYAGSAIVLAALVIAAGIELHGLRRKAIVAAPRVIVPQGRGGEETEAV